MSIFDVLGRTNIFKKGMAAGAKPFEERFAQHAEALKRLEKNFRGDWKQVKEIANAILNSTEETQRQELYGLYAQFDIIELELDYKNLLLAYLYKLSDGKSNEFQQSYIRSVQNYLDIKNPSKANDFEGIKNIDSQAAQKAIFQACIEYLFLGYNNTKFFEEYSEKLFAYFVLKDKVIDEIWGNVLNIYSATGPLGLAEKYGFVPEYKDKEKVLSGEESLFEKYEVNDLLKISSGQELVINDKEIVLRDDIECEGKLTFNNCILYYNGDNLRRFINLKNEAILVLSQCTIIGKNNEFRDEKHDKFLINGFNKQKPTARIEVDRCLFLNCLNFANYCTSVFKECVFRYTQLSQQEKKSVIDICFFHGNSIVEMYGCLFDADENIMDCDKVEKCFTDIKIIENCTFINFQNPIGLVFATSPELIPEIKKCRFKNCKNVLNQCALFYVISDSCICSNCVFDNCSGVLQGLNLYSKVKNCQFIDCSGLIISTAHGDCSIEKCEFINAKQPNNNITQNWGIHLSRNKDSGSVIMQDCVIDGINHAEFITYKDEKNKKFGINKTSCITLKNCEFKHCIADIIDKKNRDDNNKNETLILSDCRGLSGTGGGQADNAMAWEKSIEGELIGTNIRESDVGVPLFETAKN